MSFDNDHPGRKDRRRPYHDSRRFAVGCRNHGPCNVCQSRRKHKIERAIKPWRAETDEGDQS